MRERRAPAPLRGRLATAAERASRAQMRGCSADRAWLPGRPCPTLRILRARHPADRGVDVRAFGLQLIDVETAPRNPVVPHARDEDATLLERGAIRLGSGPADLEEDRVAVRGRPKDLGTEVRDCCEQRRPVGADLVDSLEGS